MASQEPSPKKRKLSISSYAEQLTILVGLFHTKFIVPKGVVCAQSDFFKAACDPQWLSGRENTVILVEEKPEIFSLFLAWVMTGDVENAEEYFELSGPPKSLAREVSAEKLFLQLAQCYVLGDVLQAPVFKNAIIDKLVALCKISGEGPDSLGFPGCNSPTVEFIFRNTTSNSHLRRLLVDFFVKSIDLEANRIRDFSMPEVAEFYFDVSVTMIEQKGKCILLPWKKDICCYHDHPGEPEKYSCTKSKKV